MTILRASLLLLLLSAPASAQDCNICGDGNFIGYPTGVVRIQYDGEERTNNCQSWQDIVANPVAISDDYCRNEMICYTAQVCRCYTPDEEFVSDTLICKDGKKVEDNGETGEGGDETGDGGDETGDGGDETGDGSDETGNGGDENGDGGDEEGGGGDNGGGADGTGGAENGGGKGGGGSPVDGLGTAVDDDGDDSSATAVSSSIAVAASLLAVLLA